MLTDSILGQFQLPSFNASPKTAELTTTTENVQEKKPVTHAALINTTFIIDIIVIINNINNTKHNLRRAMELVT